MNVSIVGTGYVGLITGACLAELGNEVMCVDVVKEKVDAINAGKPPIYEDGLDELLRKNAGKNLKATTDIEHAVLGSEITFICVGTPDAKDGGIDLKYVKSAADEIGSSLAKKSSYHVIVDKSTVVPGTTDSVILTILERASKKKAGKDFGVAMNPEFLREGRAVQDFMRPDRIVIGALDDRSAAPLEKLYKDFACPKLRTDLRTAEMIKYAANAFLAAKISFANEMANVCERVGTDFADVAKGIGLDHRIGPHFLAAGIGYGGSCFPKDVKAIIELSKKKGYAPAILEAAAQVNRGQPKHALAVLKKKLGALKGKKIAVVGIAFKPGTDDIREAPAITIIDELLKAGAVVSACDPAAVKNAKKVFGGKVEFSEKLTDCIKGADAAVIATEWPEYRTGPEVFKKLMRGNIIIDGRRVLDPAASKSAGLEYFGIGYGK